ncbi:hypothetical protein GJ496_006111 [Pomphorhynchus laevis]|nr:hypothetical protein GJ496_006111 [Pomphorhynchus laevis]
MANFVAKKLPIPMHYRETTSESGVSDLDVMTDTTTAPRCQCCPYGYHIDVDFIRFLQSDTDMFSQIRRTFIYRIALMIPKRSNLREIDSCYHSGSGLLLRHGNSSGDINNRADEQSSCASSVSGSVTLHEESTKFNSSTVTNRNKLNNSSNKATSDSSIVYRQVRNTLLELDRIVETYLKDLEKQCSSRRKSRGIRSKSVDFNNHRANSSNNSVILHRNLKIPKRFCSDFSSSSNSDNNIDTISSKHSVIQHIEETSSSSLMRSRRYRSIPNDLSNTISIKPLPPPPQACRPDSPPLYSRLKPLHITESTQPSIVKSTIEQNKITSLKSQNDSFRLELLKTLKGFENCKTLTTREVGINHKSVVDKPICVDACVNAEQNVYDRRIEQIECIYRERIKILEGRLRESQQGPEKRHVSTMFRPDVTSHCLCTDPVCTREVFIQFSPGKETGDACIQSSREPSIIYRQMPKPMQRDFAIQHYGSTQLLSSFCQTSRIKNVDRSVQSPKNCTCNSSTQSCASNHLCVAESQTDDVLQNSVHTNCFVQQSNAATLCSFTDERLRNYRDVGIDTALLLADSVVNVAINTDIFENIATTDSGCQVDRHIAHRSCSPCEEIIRKYGFQTSAVQVQPDFISRYMMTDYQPSNEVEPPEEINKFRNPTPDMITEAMQTTTDIIKPAPIGILKRNQNVPVYEERDIIDQPAYSSTRKVLTFSGDTANKESHDTRDYYTVGTRCDQIIGYYDQDRNASEQISECIKEANIQNVLDEKDLHRGYINRTASDITSNGPVELDQRDCLDEELYIACAILNEYLYVPNVAEQNKVRSALSVIQQDWFKVSTEPGANPCVVYQYLRAFKNFSNFLLERIVNLVDANGNTALHLSICSGNWRIAKLLIESKVCDVDLLNNSGYTALMQAAAMDILTEEQVFIFRFLAESATVNLRSVDKGYTALMISVQYGKVTNAGLLLESGAQMVELIIGQPDCDMFIVDNNNNTAMTLASKSGRKDILVVLYSKMKKVKGFQTKPVGMENHKNYVNNPFWSWRCMPTKDISMQMMYKACDYLSQFLHRVPSTETDIPIKYCLPDDIYMDDVYTGLTTDDDNFKDLTESNELAVINIDLEHNRNAVGMDRKQHELKGVKDILSYPYHYLESNQVHDFEDYEKGVVNYTMPESYGDGISPADLDDCLADYICEQDKIPLTTQRLASMDWVPLPLTSYIHRQPLTTYRNIRILNKNVENKSLKRNSAQDNVTEAGTKVNMNLSSEDNDDNYGDGIIIDNGGVMPGGDNVNDIDIGNDTTNMTTVAPENTPGDGTTSSTTTAPGNTTGLSSGAIYGIAGGSVFLTIIIIVGIVLAFVL